MLRSRSYRLVEGTNLKKILITGGAGFIGLALTRHFAAKAYEVHILDNFSRAVKDPELEEAAKLDNVELITCDVLNETELLSLDKDYYLIYHLAAIVGVQHVLNRPFEVLTHNVQMLSNAILLGKAQTNLERLLYASTSEAYAGTLQYFDLPVPTPETTPLATGDLSQPRTSYMLSKIYGEAMCRQSGLPFTIFRPHNIYGPRMGLSHVIPELLQRAYNMKDEDELEVFSVDHKRAFCYIDDAVNLLAAMGETEACRDEVYNLGNEDNEISIGELAQILLDTVGRKSRIRGLPATAGSPTRRCPDMSKLAEHTGLRAQVDVKEGAKRTLDWYLPVFDGEATSAK